MAKEFAKIFYKSPQWRKSRGSYIAERIRIDGGMCERCKEQQGYIVHHKAMLTPKNINNPDVALSHSNLEYVCKRCHDREEGHFLYREEESRRYEFDRYGNPVPHLQREEEPAEAGPQTPPPLI